MFGTFFQASKKQIQVDVSDNQDDSNMFPPCHVGIPTKTSMHGAVFYYMKSMNINPSMDR